MKNIIVAMSFLPLVVWGDEDFGNKFIASQPTQKINQTTENNNINVRLRKPLTSSDKKHAKMINREDYIDWIIKGRKPLFVYGKRNAQKEFDKRKYIDPNVNAQDDSGNPTLFFSAVKKGDFPTAAELVRKGADVNAKDERTPLHFAAENNSKEIGELLINNGAEVNAKDYEGWTPLHLAAAHNSKDIGEILISNKAEVNAKNAWQDSPLSLAFNTNSKGMAELLINKGADITVLRRCFWLSEKICRK